MTITTELAQRLKAAAEKYRLTLKAHQLKPRDYEAMDAWDRATSEFMTVVNNDELNIIAAILDEMETEEGYRKGAFLACNRWHDKFRKAESELEAAEKRIAELEARTEQQPVGWTDEEELRNVRGGWSGEFFCANPVSPNADPRRVIKLYREQPAPAPVTVKLPDGYAPTVLKGGTQSTSYRAIMSAKGPWIHRDMITETLAAAGIKIAEGE